MECTLNSKNELHGPSDASEAAMKVYENDDIQIYLIADIKSKFDSWWNHAHHFVMIYTIEMSLIIFIYIYNKLELCPDI